MKMDIFHLWYPVTGKPLRDPLSCFPIRTEPRFLTAASRTRLEGPVCRDRKRVNTYYGNMLTLDTVYQASFALKEAARVTDLIRAPRMFPSDEVYLKTENLQTTGSFKVRGAGFKISQLTTEEKQRS